LVVERRLPFKGSLLFINYSQNLRKHLIKGEENLEADIYCPVFYCNILNQIKAVFASGTNIFSHLAGIYIEKFTAK
jgi:hypothetical protein